eukprot:gene13717-29173_t
MLRDPSLMISSYDNTKCLDKSTTTDRQIPFPKIGVRLSVFRYFIKECGGKSELIGLSTTEVCDRFLKPLTYADGASYCDYYRHYGSDSDN